ncbi:putative MFS transporter [Aspergillus saccharolyticus JOP 1030-1]|uniref:Putative MFS transporter n=1 Tax=Aspergillus saccharolyticus JOP 1030-1 TaxID=1450539 RepID=A0A318ZLF7_9EURO|nr:putative MFS transporter [Aspergillus saccharolyticus JOP 1030-1]PYH41078.1 putative MFS transporter [Aspergillus saccharolyticus JOP 1030-1]
MEDMKFAGKDLVSVNEGYLMVFDAAGNWTWLEAYGKARHSQTPTFPEGGLKACLAVLSCWCVMFNTFGYINAFAIYEAYYKSTFLHAESASNIARIGSLHAFFMFSAGLISGPLMDRYGPRIILIPCSLLFILSIMLTSLCTEYYQFLLAQGILGGFMNGLTYTPALTAVNQYFLRRPPLAMGIASVRIIGFLMLTLSLIACLSISTPSARRQSGPLLNHRAWRHPAYTYQVGGLFLVMWALFTPFFYVPAFAQSSLHLSTDLSNALISIMNAGSFAGRLLTGLLANQIGRFNGLVVSSAISGVLILSWLAVDSPGVMIVFSVLFGFFSGAVIGLFTATLPNVIGSYLGMALGVFSLACLTGPPITGAMITRYGSYEAAMVFARVSALLGAVVIAIARVCFAGWRRVA